MDKKPLTVDEMLDQMEIKRVKDAAMTNQFSRKMCENGSRTYVRMAYIAGPTDTDNSRTYD